MMFLISSTVFFSLAHSEVPGDDAVVTGRRHGNKCWPGYVTCKDGLFCTAKTSVGENVIPSYICKNPQDPSRTDKPIVTGRKEGQSCHPHLVSCKAPFSCEKLDKKSGKYTCQSNAKLSMMEAPEMAAFEIFDPNARPCCWAENAFCLSACAGKTEEEYCAENPNVLGCPGRDTWFPTWFPMGVTNDDHAAAPVPTNEDSAISMPDCMVERETEYSGSVVALDMGFSYSECANACYHTDGCAIWSFVRTTPRGREGECIMMSYSPEGTAIEANRLATSGTRCAE